MPAPSLARTAAPGQPLGHRQILVVFSGLLLAMLLAALDSTIVSTALPTMVGELGGLERLAWVVTGYLLAQTVVTPIYGKLSDLYGRKIVLQSAVVLFLIGSMLCGLSRTMTQLILFRAGGGGLMVTSQALVGDIIPPRDRGQARRAHLADLAADWDPSRHPDAQVFLAQAGERVVPDARR
jgi:MFS family permease